MKYRVVFLVVATSLVLLAGCQKEGVSQQTTSSPEASSHSNSSSLSEAMSAETSSDTDEIILENASMDFTVALGFKVVTWVGSTPVETKIIGAKVAEIKWEQDMTSTAYLRIAANGAENLMPIFDGAFEEEYTEVIGDITVTFRYSVGGPMYASWEKNELQFCFYQKEGEATAARQSFSESVSYYVNDIVLSK